LKEIDPIQLVRRVGEISIILVALTVLAYALVPEAREWVPMLALTGIASVGAVAAYVLWLSSQPKEKPPKPPHQDFLDAVLFAGFVTLVGGLWSGNSAAVIAGFLLILISLAAMLGWMPSRTAAGSEQSAALLESIESLRREIEKLRRGLEE